MAGEFKWRVCILLLMTTIATYRNQIKWCQSMYVGTLLCAARIRSAVPLSTKEMLDKIFKFFFDWFYMRCLLSIWKLKKKIWKSAWSAFLEWGHISLKVWNTNFLKNISTKGLIRCPKGVKVLIRWKSFPLKVW